MRKQNSFGFTLVELLAVIVVLVIILAIAIPGISGIIKNATKSSFKSDAKMVLKAIDYKKLENSNFDPLTITKTNMQEEIGLNGDNYAQISFSIVDNNVRVVLVGAGKWDGLTAYGTFKNINVVNSDDYDVTPPVITVTGENPVTVVIGNAYTDAGATATDLKDGDVTANIVTTGSVNTAVLGAYTITYTVADAMGNEETATRTINVIKDSNAPVLAAGMTPVKWNGAAWVNTTADDVAWYNYTTTDKQWANAKTADGSYWVWIPRYVYKISSGWHTATAGTIEVKFSIGTDDTRGGTVTLDTGTTSNASNNKWTNHPAFTFGSTQLTGIWVAKFEPTASEGLANTAAGDNVTTKTIKILPSVQSWRNIQVGNAFTVSRNMETNSVYGWGTSGTGIDTHLIKNVEWGAVAYLSKSTYGINAEIWVNPSSTFITGCGGTAVSIGGSSGCSYYYNTSNGQKTSSTGTIYGVYDFSGGAYEYVSAYDNTTTSDLATYGSEIINADAKYKNAYPKHSYDDDTNNYLMAVNLKGDAIYETSSNGDFGNSAAWYTDYSGMVYANYPWFQRGGCFGSTTQAGAFYFFISHGSSDNQNSFRPVLVVGAGL